MRPATIRFYIASTFLLASVSACEPTADQLRGDLAGSSGGDAMAPLAAAVPSCGELQAWAAGSYVGGDYVTDQSHIYECKHWPYEGWCGQSAYEPGVGFAWQDAWLLIESCEDGGSGTGDGGGDDEGTCTPIICSSIGARCGDPDDGCGGLLDCGQCPSGEVCNAADFSCESNCVPTSCAAQNAQCGQIADGCGGSLDCGRCAANESCNQATHTCEPPTDPTGCGDDAFEDNDVASSAPVLVDGSYDAVGCRGEDDYFSFDLSAGDMLDLGIMFHKRRGNIDAELFGPSGALVAESKGSGHNEWFEFTATNSGRHVLRTYVVDDKEPSYRIDVTITRDSGSDSDSDSDSDDTGTTSGDSGSSTDGGSDSSSSDTGGDETGSTDGGIADMLSASQFEQMFPNRLAFYTYTEFVAAADSITGFADSGDITRDKQELAAFLGQVAHETGHLRYIEEINGPGNAYCDEQPWFCNCNHSVEYYGRGVIQLSWNYNYCRAGDYLGLDLQNDPDLVARDSKVAWQTGLWFWMTQTGAGSRTCHDAMVGGHGFGETTRTINGALECDGRAPSKVQARANYYTTFSNILGVPTVSPTGC